MSERDSSAALSGACVRSREIIQDVLDGPVDASRIAALDDHLAGCEACRDYRDGLQSVQSVLRRFEEAPLPGDALRDVWSRTVDADDVDASAARFGWRSVAAIAAATVVMAVLIAWVQLAVPPQPHAPVAEQRGTTPEPSAEEIEIAAREAMQVLELTARALQRGRNAAVGKVLGEQISPAVRRIPIQWHESPAATSRRSKT